MAAAHTTKVGLGLSALSMAVTPATAFMVPGVQQKPNTPQPSLSSPRGAPAQLEAASERTSSRTSAIAAGGLAAAVVAAVAPRRSKRAAQGKRRNQNKTGKVAFVAPQRPSAPAATTNVPPRCVGRLVVSDQLALDALDQLAVAANDPATTDAVQAVKDFFFDPRLQWDANGNVLLDPQGNPLPDNLWTQFVAVQATLIKRLDQGIHGLGIEQSFGLAVCAYTLGIRTALYPFVKGQLETTAKIKVLTPRVNELKEKYKDDEDRMNQEVGMLYMDLQIDPLAAIIPLLVQLPVFWGLYRAIRRLAIVEYDHLKDPFLWIPSLYGPNFAPDPSFDWLTKWQGPLIELHPKMGWENFLLYATLPAVVVTSYSLVLKEAIEDKSSPAILKFFPFLLGFITCELPQAMGLYIATNIASSVALTNYTTDQISSKIPGYDEFVKTGTWPAGVDPEKVLAEAFGVKRLSDGTGTNFDTPTSVPEAIFAGRADYIPKLLEEGRKIDEFDDRGIPASAYSMALDKTDVLERLFELGADPKVIDKKGNCLLHYMAGYGRSKFLQVLLDKGLSDMLNHQNEDKQTALDVARMNLSVENVADGVRPVIQLLVDAGAEGNVTTQEDEARFEKAREQKKKDAEVKAARDALKMMAQRAQMMQEAKDAEAKAAAAASAEGEGEEEQQGGAAQMLTDSLDRVRNMDIDSLRERLGGKLPEEQLEKLAARLKTMSPEDLAKFAAGLPSVKAEAAEAPAAPPADQAPDAKRVSVLVD